MKKLSHSNKHLIISLSNLIVNSKNSDNKMMIIKRNMIHTINAWETVDN
jgi:hypothetical protein